MVVIGLTGGIGTGKTQVSTTLEYLGAEIINADLLGHEAYVVARRRDLRRGCSGRERGGGPKEAGCDRI